ncbi:MAG: restriction endonuclease subunit S, partial [Gammaproteobacteria bacterium]
KAKEDLTAYRLAYPGDIVLNSINVVVGSVGLSKYFGAVSPVYYMLYPRKKEDLIEYFDAIFQNESFQKSLVGLGNGILVKKSESSGKLNTIRMRIPMSKLNMVLIPYPSPLEQSAIAAFLEYKTAQIDQAVSIKEQQIALLKERKQILIQNAVTRGLDSNVPMRDSGVEWIGEIPAHWNCSRLKVYSKIQSGITLGKSYRQQNFVEMPYIRVANVQNGYFKLDDIAIISVPNNEISRYLLQDGDILATEGGDIDKLGRGTVWREYIKPCLHQNHVFAIRVNKLILFQDFVSSFLSTDIARKYFIDTATKTTNLASTNRTHLGNLYLPIPSLSEQKTIVFHIETQSAKIDQAIAVQQQQIDKLKEYKATLINSAVTGKIRVPDSVQVERMR